MNSTIRTTTFIKSGVSQKNTENKRFVVRRKDWDAKLETPNEVNRKALAGMLTSRILSSRPTNNGVHRRDTRVFNMDLGSV